MAEGLRLSAVLLGLLVVKWTCAVESVQKCANTPMKQIVCEFGTAKAIADFDACLCTHVAIPVSLESEKDDDQTPDFTQTIVKTYRETNSGLKSLAAVTVYAEDVAKKSGRVGKEIVDVLGRYDGVQLDLRQSDVSVDKSLVVHFFKELSSEIDSKFQVPLTANGSSVPLKKPKEIQLVLPPNAAVLTKFYDLKKLAKYVDFFIIATHNLVDGSEQGYTYHPSRLMGADDLLNADSLVDLVIGLGVDHPSILLSLPSTASKFVLKDPTKNTPRAPTVGLPTTIPRPKMCEEMRKGNWTIERDEDLTAPYAFMNETWMSFDDSVSVSIKGKYILLRDLAGAVVTDVEALDWKSTCSNRTAVEPLEELAKTFVETARKSRSAQLLSLQEQLQRPADRGFYFDNEISHSPYYIERVVTREGDVHAIRKDAKTEFECSRQGYFRHPSGCNRFYRCVKFDQRSNYFTVYEYDCPDGLAFDEKVEVCVWPGSLSHTGACQGSSEIAPVPRNQFVCPSVEGYYADPENCRWFFACLDHGRDGHTPLTAYEFRCPFGLVFDEKSLKCDWPWKVGPCGGNSGRPYARNYGEQQPYAALQPAAYQTNQLYEKAPFVPHAWYSQDRPRFSIDSVDTYHDAAPAAKLDAPYYTTEKPKISFGPAEYHVPSNSPGFSQQSYVPTSTRFPYGLPENYGGSTIKPAQTFYGSTAADTYSGTGRPLPPYGFTGSTIRPESPYGFTESYATATSRPQLFSSPANVVGHPSSIKPQYSYGSTEAYGTTGKPQYSYGPTEAYGTTGKPQYSYGSTEAYGTTGKPAQIAHDEANVYADPNQPGRSVDFDYSRFDNGPLGILFHQHHVPKADDAQPYRSSAGVLLHQQNDFLGTPVNLNYDSHKNDVQYPPIRDYERAPLQQTKTSSSRLYSESYSPSSNVYSGPSVPYAGPYAILAGANGYDSHRVNERYQPTYSTTTDKQPAVESSGPPIFHAAKPTSTPFRGYSDESGSRGYSIEQAGGHESPQSSSPSNVDFRISTSTPREPAAAAFHDTGLHGSRFDLGPDYRSRIPSHTYPSSTTTPAFYSGSPSSAFDVPAYSTTAVPPPSYPVSSTTAAYPPPNHGSAVKPTVNYYDASPAPPHYVTPVSHDDSAFVERLIAELSKVPLAPARPPTADAEPLSFPQHTSGYVSFDVDEYASALRSAGLHSVVTTPTPTGAPPKSSTTAVPSLPLAGYSSTASDLIDYYHDLHSSLDSAYRSPVGDPLLQAVNYTLPARDYALDAGHNVHDAYAHGGYYAAPYAYPLKPIVVEPVSAEANAEFERYYTAGVRAHLKAEDDGRRVLVAGDASPPLLVGKLGAQCDCSAAKEASSKPTVTVVSTTVTSTVIDGADGADDYGKTVKGVETRTSVVLEDAAANRRPTASGKLCTRPGLFRDPKRCDKFYSCNWDKWTQKYQLSDFKCPIHLAFDENLSACNWPSKGPACSHDTLISYAN